ELWDLSLVDPDNRRPVDFGKRMEWLDSLQNEVDLKQLWNERYGGKIKLWITSMLLNLRRQQPYLFSSGEYQPLKVEGAYKDHIIAFARKYRQNIIVVVLPLHTAIICKEQGVDVLDIDWKDTMIFMPGDSLTQWDNLTGEGLNLKASKVEAGEVFRLLPFGLLKGQKLANERSAGILLHISSLPSQFGIGDMGPGAKAFADFLQRSSQKYWQLLPLNPTEKGQGHSPYSSISSRAGNVLFISPELLVNDGLLTAADLHTHQVINDGHTNFSEAERVKSLLLDKAWNQYQGEDSHPYKKDFQAFEEKEKEWLNDFATYVLLKQEHGGKPWYEWPGEYKFHDEQALQKIVEANEALIQKIKWLQFVFSKQWHDLRIYCNRSGIQFIGDLPFYVSYDSADVWAHRHLFALDEQGNRTGIAGVPPDAFSADGQLWGMPVFKWEEHKNENYKWWIERLKKNIELFDLVRLDHFRAFSAYWEVPAGETTAKNGEWKPGPASNFFTAIQNELGALPFVAEDLGEIDEPVYQLRDAFHLPGMKVLQFAFGGDMHRSVHIPHNYKENFIVYTGTHDNNTLRGWFASEAGEETRLALERYIGRPVSAAEVHIILSRMAYASVARVVILPVQDLLNLDEKARMNIPASAENNWTWRLLPGQVDKIAEINLKNWTRMFNRET
ncbi:MAG TPA: 4-alpha-glucanotransferase, partial [Flavisolibacter sp.]